MNGNIAKTNRTRLTRLIVSLAKLPASTKSLNYFSIEQLQALSTHLTELREQNEEMTQQIATLTKKLLLTQQIATLTKKVLLNGHNSERSPES